MPVCSIVTCGARSKESQPQQLSLHRFPRKVQQRKKWLEAIGEQYINTRHKVQRVCSRHFKDSCFNRTLNVLRLRDNSVPTEFLIPKKQHQESQSESSNIKNGCDDSCSTEPLQLSQKIAETVQKGPVASAPSSPASSDLSMEDDNQVEIKVCRVCLGMEVRMFDIKDFKLTEMFQNVTGISVCNKKESIRQRVCWECAARLAAAAAFKNKALLSDALLKDISHMNKNDIARLKYIYRDSLSSPLTIEPAFTDDTGPDYKETDDETDCEDDDPLENIPLTTKGSDPVVGNNSNIETKNLRSEILSTIKDTIENSEVYCDNNDKVLSEDAEMTDAPINDDCYIVIVTGDEENKSKLDVVRNTVNETLSKKDTQSPEVASTNKAKKVTIRKVEASSEQGNRLNDGEKQKINAMKEKGLSVAKTSEEMGKSLTVQNIKTINRLNNQLISSLSSKHFEVNRYDSHFEYEDQPNTIQNKSPPTRNADIKDKKKIFLTNKKDDGLNGPGVNGRGVNDPGFDDDGIADTDVLNDKDIPFEEEYVLSDKENYSSDDSLPSEKCKEKSVAKSVNKIKDPTESKIDRRVRPLINEDLNFTYTELTLEEQIAEIEKRQESSNYKNAVFNCTACYKGFLDLCAYNSHMLRHTNQFGEYKCTVCKKHFKQKYALRKHMVAHKQRYSCNACPFVTKSVNAAARHKGWHEGTKYTCPHCNVEFNQFTTYMGHLRIQHPSDFVCELCGYSFVSAKGIEVHKNLKHPLENVQIPEDGPLCELCNLRFVSSEALQRHLSVSAKHNTDKKSRKPNEPKYDISRRVLVDGRWRRKYPGKLSDADRIPCEQCGVELENSRAYFIHFRRMHPDKNRTKFPSMKAPCMCEACGRMLPSYYHLKEHVCLHVRERRFTCEACGKAFRTKGSLASHQLMHKQVRRTYECAVCGKKFSSYGNRHRHMVIHSGLKPFKCEICGKDFKQQAEKRIHVTYVHLKKPWPKRTRRKRKSETGQV